MTAEEDIARYRHAMHAMQTGIAMLLEHDPSPATAKHVRVGINSSKVEHGALVKLLIDRGIITDAEYLAAIADAAEAEVITYEQELRRLLKADITLL